MVGYLMGSVPPPGLLLLYEDLIPNNWPKAHNSCAQNPVAELDQSLGEGIFELTLSV